MCPFPSSFSQVLSLPLFFSFFGACAAPNCGSAKSCCALLATCSLSLVRTLPIVKFLSFALFFLGCLFAPSFSIFFFFFSCMFAWCIIKFAMGSCFLFAFHIKIPSNCS
ncbi:hypothetical protein M758_3G243900 [Ceratodon purpureus]|uniref:Uncharacterized protein n=1 Tax=Ceratodon purpureus TaxID=3225 RepID=A0A8T0IPI7_CERPU|nr:hypothetical protein KC19_3G243800 [Ceratodon purpureus]KAG0624386.1 hypothetical protein M758_3G243900 [Ceratodon purpureus]